MAREKGDSQLPQHGVSFEEAATVFNDPLATVYEDPDHSINERRFLIIGTSARRRILHIAFADRGERIRIIKRSQGD